MGLFTTTDDPALNEARKRVVPGQLVCASCKQAFTKSGETLAMWNEAIGIEGHKCPSCGQMTNIQQPSFDF